MSRPLIAVTLGEPAGIGPEVSFRAVANPVVRKEIDVLVICGPKWPHRIPANVRCHYDTRILPGNYSPGHPTKTSSRAAVTAIKVAVELWREGKIDGLVTAPVSKEAIRKTGIDFPGHTEFLARLTGSARVAMFFASPHIKVVLVTRHVSLKKVSAAVTPAAIIDAVELVSEHYPDARFAVCALNPHGGEQGPGSGEEKKVIIPAIARLKRKGINIQGPFPADTLFWRARSRKDIDIIVAMYHDQGLIPVKLLDWEKAVNVTFGLPFPRTSPIHGTGLDIAGKIAPDFRPMISAILACGRLVRGKKIL